MPTYDIETGNYFAKFSQELANAGVKKGSPALILERVRWEMILQTKNGRHRRHSTEEQHLYATRFQQEYPRYSNFFKLRRDSSIPKSQLEFPFGQPA